VVAQIPDADLSHYPNTVSHVIQTPEAALRRYPSSFLDRDQKAVRRGDVNLVLLGRRVRSPGDRQVGARLHAA
jgi:hypothetical protein